MELDLNNAEVVALTKAIKAAELTAARKGLTVGEHPIDITCRVTGNITVGEQEDYTPTISIPIKSTLALFIRYCGVTRKAAEAALVRAMTEALNQDVKGEEKNAIIQKAISENEEVIATCEAKVKMMVGALPKAKRDGKVRSNLTVTPVEVSRN